MNGNLLHLPNIWFVEHIKAVATIPLGSHWPRGNAHLNSLTRATRATRVTALWPRALQLVDGIQGAALEPSLPTKNVPRAEGEGDGWPWDDHDPWSMGDAFFVPDGLVFLCSFGCNDFFDVLFLRLHRFALPLWYACIPLSWKQLAEICWDWLRCWLAPWDLNVSCPWPWNCWRSCQSAAIVVMPSATLRQWRPAKVWWKPGRNPWKFWRWWSHLQWLWMRWPWGHFWAPKVAATKRVSAILGEDPLCTWLPWHTLP